MKNLKFVLMFGFLLAMFSIFADAELEVRKIDKGSTVISELNNPAVFDFIINNRGGKEDAEIYSLISVSMTPSSRFVLEPGETKIEVKANPGESIRSRERFLSFEYQIKGSSSGIFRDNLMIKIVQLIDVFEIEPLPLNPANNTVKVKVRNKENTHLKDVEIEFNSVFFSEIKKVSLEPYEETIVDLNISKDISKLVAGSYVISAGINIDGKETKIAGVMNYLESEGTSIEKSSKGIIVRKTLIKKTNYGNIPVTASIDAKKDIISRLFTTYSFDPEKIERRGLTVYYTWSRDLSPSESYEIEIATNYTIPFIIILLIVLVGVIAKTYSQGAVRLEKRVAFVKTKGGQFALKVNIYVKAKKRVEKVQIIDKLPSMTKLYEDFGKKPDRIDKATRRIFWNIERLSLGEERIYSYIIYSDMSVEGRFELPAATAVFEKDGKTQETWSNRTFFVAQTSKGE